MSDNVLIARFMGHRIEYFPTIPPRPTGAVLIDGQISEMKYDKSWDWLMPVVHKCRDMQTGPWNDMSRLQYDFIEQALVNVDLPAIYKAVVEFIKWKTE